MKKIYAVIYILAIISLFSTDFLIRALLPGRNVLLNVCIVILALIAALSFWKVIGRVKEEDSLPAKTKESGSKPASTWVSQLLRPNDPLLVVRFFAAFLVFITHVRLCLKPNDAILTGTWFFLKGGAHTGMVIFFTLSGYLMCKAFHSERYKFSNQGIWTFYKNRWIRIYPLAFFVFIFFSVLLYPAIFRFEISHVLRLLTFSYYGNVLSYPGIGALWSLSVEFQYYLIAPFIFYVLDPFFKTNKLSGFIIVIAFIAGLTYLKYYAYTLTAFHLTGYYNSISFSLLGNLSFFMVGYLFNYVTPVFNRTVSRIFRNDIMLLLLFIGSLLVIGHAEDREYDHPEFIIAFFLLASFTTGMIIAILDFLRVKSEKKFRLSMIFQTLGVLSYGFYLWHSGIAFIHGQLFPAGFNNIQMYITELCYIGIVVFFISFLSYFLVEDRFNKYKMIKVKK